MKNYFDQQKELEIAYSRLITLNEQKKMYFENTQPAASKIKEVVIQTMSTSDPFFDYVLKIQVIDEKIAILNKEISLLEKNLELMAKNIRQMKSIEYKVFSYRYIDGLSVKSISKLLGYSEPQIYRIISIIKEILKR